ncbi:hypothetical protein [Methylobacterium oxalidis]|uniref:Uncharacterized protein n=1 Tax=Methylobacterium oxalidis TaxID=944322 RepID=A0ABQ6DMP2_9HYPH|nr:hypothetical protein [Methylobacterium oxalidis]GJE35725.1 hypothetical protein LDDCCGHA_5945 [Methylobacterium oxalidis]GLS65374.1 hypothetical protein GCM10007888_37560 [Methylobacterium oxalidis]
MAHAMQTAPLLAAFGLEGAIQDGLAQAWPLRLAVIKGGQRVAILHVGGHDRECQKMTLGTVDTRQADAQNTTGTTVCGWP